MKFLASRLLAKCLVIDQWDVALWVWFESWNVGSESDSNWQRLSRVSHSCFEQKSSAIVVDWNNRNSESAAGSYWFPIHSDLLEFEFDSHLFSFVVFLMRKKILDPQSLIFCFKIVNCLLTCARIFQIFVTPSSCPETYSNFNYRVCLIDYMKLIEPVISVTLWRRCSIVTALAFETYVTCLADLWALVAHKKIWHKLEI